MNPLVMLLSILSVLACKPQSRSDGNVPTPAPSKAADQVVLPASTPGMAYTKNGEKLSGICQSTQVEGAGGMQCAEYFTGVDQFNQLCPDEPSTTADGRIYQYTKRVVECPSGATHGCVYKKNGSVESVVWSYNAAEKCVDESAPVDAPKS